MRNILLSLFLIGLSLKAISQNIQGFETSAIKELVAQADSCYKASEKDCDVIYKKAIHLVKDQSKDNLSLIYHKLATYYARNNATDSAIKYMEIGQKMTDDENAIDAFMNLHSTVLYNEGRNSEAIAIDIQLAERLNQREEWNRLAYVYTNIGNQYAALDDHEQSIHYLFKSFEILEEQKDSMFISLVAAWLADGYLTLEQDTLAYQWSHKALKLSAIDENQESKVVANYTLGRLSIENNADSALFYFEQAIAIGQDLPNKTYWSNALGYKARSLRKLNRSKEAVQVIEEAVIVAKEYGFTPGLLHHYKEAAYIYLDNHSYEKAAYYFDEYLVMSDSIKSKERYQTIQELSTKYETEKKEKLLAQNALKIKEQNLKLWVVSLIGLMLLLLSIVFYFYYKMRHQLRFKQWQKEKENAILQSFIQGEERERNRISHELHDNIASLIVAAKMSIESVPFLSEEKQSEQVGKASNLLDVAHADIRHIAHNLLPIVLEDEGLIKAIEHYAFELNQTGLIEITVEDPHALELDLSYQIQLLLFRIIQELMSNIIKHSQAKVAKIIFHDTDEGLQIEVIDDGVGYDGEITSKSQGLYSINQRLKSIGGRFKFIKQFKGMKAVLEIQHQNLA